MCDSWQLTLTWLWHDTAVVLFSRKKKTSDGFGYLWLTTWRALLFRPRGKELSVCVHCACDGCGMCACRAWMGSKLKSMMVILQGSQNNNYKTSKFAGGWGWGGGWGSAYGRERGGDTAQPVSSSLLGVVSLKEAGLLNLLLLTSCVLLLSRIYLECIYTVYPFFTTCPLYITFVSCLSRICKRYIRYWSCIREISLYWSHISLK